MQRCCCWRRSASTSPGGEWPWDGGAVGQGWCWGGCCGVLGGCVGCRETLMGAGGGGGMQVPQGADRCHGAMQMPWGSGGGHGAAGCRWVPWVLPSAGGGAKGLWVLMGGGGAGTVTHCGGTQVPGATWCQPGAGAGAAHARPGAVRRLRRLPRAPAPEPLRPARGLPPVSCGVGGAVTCKGPERARAPRCRAQALRVCAEHRPRAGAAWLPGTPTASGCPLGAASPSPRTSRECPQSVSDPLSLAQLHALLQSTRRLVCVPPFTPQPGSLPRGVGALETASYASPPVCTQGWL